MALIVDDVNPSLPLVGDNHVPQPVHTHTVRALVQVLALHVRVAQSEEEFASEGEPHHTVRGEVGNEDVAVVVHGQPVGFLQQLASFGGKVLIGQPLLQPPVSVIHCHVTARLCRFASQPAEFGVAIGGHQQAAGGGGRGKVQPKALQVDVCQHGTTTVLTHDLDLIAVVATGDDHSHLAISPYAVHVPVGGDRDLTSYDPVLLQDVDGALVATAQGGHGGDDDVTVRVDPHALDVVPGNDVGQHEFLAGVLQQLSGDVVLGGTAGLERGVGMVCLVLSSQAGVQASVLVKGAIFVHSIDRFFAVSWSGGEVLRTV